MVKRRIAWLLLLLAALGMYLFENNGGTRIVLLTLLLAPVCSALMLYLPPRRLTAQLGCPDTLQRGQRALCTLTLQNSGRLPLLSAGCALEVRNLLTGEESRLAVAGSVGAREEALLEIAITAEHCGKLVVHAAGLHIIDIFGLFARRVPWAESRTVMVLPKASPVAVSLADTADFLIDSEQYSTQKPGYDPSETFRIREYVPGDPIRQIHWKLSQKTDAVLVRDFGLPVVNEVLLLVETTGLPGAMVSPKDADALLDLLFSLCQALISLEIPHTVGWQDSGNGSYESVEVWGVECLPELRSRLLGNPIKLGDCTVAGCYGQSHLRCEYSHAAVLSPYLAPDLSALCHGNRVTVLMPCEQAPDSSGANENVFVIPYTAAELAEGRLYLEL